MTDLIKRFTHTRNRTNSICTELQTEDFNLQGAEFTSPPKWHLAHTTWFFEEMILKRFVKDYKLFNPHFSLLFNSYYNLVGERIERKNRGLLSRPSVKEVLAYREYVDHEMRLLLSKTSKQSLLELLNLGIQHEEQHQELLQTDIKYSLYKNPLNRINNQAVIKEPKNSKDPSHSWIEIKEGIFEIGFQGEGFCFDNELGRHKVYLEAFEICRELVTNGEFMEFIEMGGYENFNLWLDDGWTWVNTNSIKAPLYWRKKGSGWVHFSTKGEQPVDPDAYVNHVSYYEAMAFATWKGCRLPTEFEWEAAAEMFDWGQRWEWTNSAYLPYPGFTIAEGAAGEYNGKFMSNQMVLRGASAVTTPGHSRKSYRNFFQPELKWQYSGIRLAK
ncbi:MAG: ergothioneine biosynthesis protein EgtB [Flavobacteriaceae bacterium]|nr:MAG: ergothioneine biosynthesis protein EgtB [Flavobacteriaceae bacterium]